MRRLILLLALIAVSGCAHSSNRNSCDGWRTSSGICVEGVENRGDVEILLNGSFAEAQNCWDHIMDGNTLKVQVRDVPTAYAKAYTITSPLTMRYVTMRHEFSHVVSLHKYGAAWKNYSGRCWLGDLPR